MTYLAVKLRFIDNAHRRACAQALPSNCPPRLGSGRRSCRSPHREVLSIGMRSHFLFEAMRHDLLPIGPAHSGQSERTIRARAKVYRTTHGRSARHGRRQTTALPPSLFLSLPSFHGVPPVDGGRWRGFTQLLLPVRNAIILRRSTLLASDKRRLCRHLILGWSVSALSRTCTISLLPIPIRRITHSPRARCSRAESIRRILR